MPFDRKPLSEHVDFISENIIFRLDASLVLISVRQNRLMKVVSVADAVHLPPPSSAPIRGWL